MDHPLEIATTGDKNTSLTREWQVLWALGLWRRADQPSALYCDRSIRLRRSLGQIVHTVANRTSQRFRYMSDTAAASQPCYHSLNRNQWNILLVANLGWLPRDIEQRYLTGRPDDLQPGRYTFRI